MRNDHRMNRRAWVVWSGFCVTLGNTTNVPMVMGHTALPGFCVSVLWKAPVAGHSLLASADLKASMEGLT